MTSDTRTVRTAGEWRDALASPHTAIGLGFPDVYGPDETLWFQRLRALARAMECYQTHFGDAPVRVFRAPGRINLRGMHVDTHGGFLNLMTHQREVLVVAGMGSAGTTRIANTAPEFAPIAMVRDELPHQVAGETWAEFIDRSDVRDRVHGHTGRWGNYVEGAWLRAAMALGAENAGGLNIVVDSNLPRGAALSSSAALCIALLHAWFGWNGKTPSQEALILAAQDAEWYTGSRCGTCDQAAIVLGQPGRVIHGALLPKAFTTEGMMPVALPDELCVLVINSYTRRNISGAEKVAYTRNRFAYSMAMEIFQQTLRDMGYDDGLIARCDRLSEITSELLGGDGALYTVLQRIPESLDLPALRARYDLPDLDDEYARYFGDVDKALRPTSIGLRGPLLFGIAESERARHFGEALRRGDVEYAGKLMTWGHEGDRRFDRAGKSTAQSVDDAAITRMMEAQTPIVACPGAYGASSAALDCLVDCALDHGALGASLTGAGIAGTVLALCRTESAAAVAEGLRAFMAGETYRQTAQLREPLSAAALEEAVVVNCAVSGAGPITF